jgi:hypothetical protein
MTETPERRKHWRMSWLPLPKVLRWNDTLPDLSLTPQARYEAERKAWREQHKEKDIRAKE